MININITTYPKRDKYLYKMLNHFSKQTYKPDRIILWLCHEEYDINNLPETIIKCKNFLTDIMWCEKNIYCHKRYEVFKYYNNDFNIFIDDDTYYPFTFIEELINHCKQTNNVTCYYSYIQEFNNIQKITIPLNNTANKRKIALQGSCICWPPNTFPLESFKYENIRDILCKKCDESWLNVWCIKNNILIDGLHDFIYRISKPGRLIDDADNIGLCYEVCSINNSIGIRIREDMLCSAIKYFNLENKAKEIWPNLNIDKCALTYNNLKNLNKI